MAQREPTASAALYPHLPSAAREPIKQSEPRLADAMYPRPKPPPQPVPRQSREAAMDWSDVDPRFARLVGLVPKGRR